MPGLILFLAIFLLGGCSQQVNTTSSTTTSQATSTATSTTATVLTVDRSYKCLTAQGDFIPVQTVAISNRLDKLDGKTIYVVQGEADPIIMPALFKAVMAKYTNTKWVFYQPASNYGISTVDDEIKKQANACIRGIGW